MLNTTSNNQSREITSTEPIFHGILSNKLTSTKPSLDKTTFNFDIQVVAMESIQRNEIEHFIKQGFLKNYQAKISVTMPHLLSLCNGKYKAALGIRRGKDNLFIEQYISGGIEQQPVFVENNITRRDIVEIGHLFSNNQRFTIPLFMITAVSLFYMNYKYMVFSGTEKVINLMEKSGVHCTHLCDAHENKIESVADEWGSYYSTNPKVIAVSLLDVIALIGRNSTYQKMFQLLNKQIAQTCQQLR
jgi:hypothetical protein